MVFSGSTTLNGFTKVNGSLVITGSNTLLVPQQGDLSMGDFTVGQKPQ